MPGFLLLTFHDSDFRKAETIKLNLLLKMHIICEKELK